MDRRSLLGGLRAACAANAEGKPIVCAERPDPGPVEISANERVCTNGVAFLTFEAMHRTPAEADPEEPWFCRLYANARSTPPASGRQ